MKHCFGLCGQSFPYWLLPISSWPLVCSVFVWGTRNTQRGPDLTVRLFHTAHCDLLSGLHTVSLETAVPGRVPSWWKGVLIMLQGGTTCWSRGQGESVENAACLGHFTWLRSPFSQGLHSLPLLFAAPGRFIMFLLPPRNRLLLLSFMAEDFTEHLWFKFAPFLKTLPGWVLCYVFYTSTWETEAERSWVWGKPELWTVTVLFGLWGEPLSLK